MEIQSQNISKRRRLFEVWQELQDDPDCRRFCFAHEMPASEEEKTLFFENVLKQSWKPLSSEGLRFALCHFAPRHLVIPHIETPERWVQALEIAEWLTSSNCHVEEVALQSGNYEFASKFMNYLADATSLKSIKWNVERIEHYVVDKDQQTTQKKLSVPMLMLTLNESLKLALPFLLDVFYRDHAIGKIICKLGGRYRNPDHRRDDDEKLQTLCKLLSPQSRTDQQVWQDLCSRARRKRFKVDQVPLTEHAKAWVIRGAVNGLVFDPKDFQIALEHFFPAKEFSFTSSVKEEAWGYLLQTADWIASDACTIKTFEIPIATENHLDQLLSRLAGSNCLKMLRIKLQNNWLERPEYIPRPPESYKLQLDDFILKGLVYEQNMRQLQDVFAKKHDIKRAVCKVDFEPDDEAGRLTDRLAALLTNGGVADLKISGPRP
ncbi:hypothetical protein VARIO8X_20110 [Burkholderiales bacterium 8X]|nr:hypothetical protein VARIO8X_20110 [Burkholderiales bacterium 8X]